MNKITNNDEFKHTCPLCNSKSVNNIDTFKSEILINLYKKAYDYDISYLVKNTKEIELKKCSECSLIYFYPNISGDNKFYQMLQYIPNYYFDDKFEYQIVKKYFSKGKDVLEIGAGKGAFSKKIDKNSYIGLELSNSAIQIAKQNGVTLYNQKIQDFAANNINKKFDIIVSFQVLEHVELQELHSFIASSLELLKTGGKFIVCVPSNSSFVGGIPNAALNLPPHHITRWADDTFVKMEQIFPVKIVSVNYEPLKPVNYNGFILYQIFKFFHIQIKVAHNRKLFLFLYSIINTIIKKSLPKKVKHLIIKKIKPRGHSIIIVYEKL